VTVRYTNTSASAQTGGLKVLVHGPSGAGKTTLMGTTGEPTVIISAEGGMLSLARQSIPVIEIDTIDDLKSVYQFLASAQGQQFRWIGLDSVSDIAEKVLSAYKRKNKDPRKAYNEMADDLWEMVRQFRDMPGRNVIFTAKQERMKDESSGITSYVASLPSNRTSQGIDYFFDEVFALRVERDPGDPLKVTRYLQTGRDYAYSAKDRSGVLAMFEPPNLAYVKAKIQQALQPQA
jgi:hypothetical protein